MKANTIKAAWAALLIVLSSNAMAAGTVTSTIYRIYVNPGSGVVLVKMNAAPTGTRACSTSPTWDFGMTLPTSISPVRDTLAALLTAHAASRSVTVNGTGACTAFGTAEDISTIYMY